MKQILISTALILLVFCANFGIFLFAYKKLAFPFIEESQRMDNAPYIFTYVLLAFLLSSIFTVLAQKFLLKSNT